MKRHNKEHIQNEKCNEYNKVKKVLQWNKGAGKLKNKKVKIIKCKEQECKSTWK